MWPDAAVVAVSLAEPRFDHRFSVLLNWATVKLLVFGGAAGPVAPAVAEFVAANLVRMGAALWHDASNASLAQSLGLDRRRAVQLRRASQDAGLLTVRRLAAGRRSITLPGPLVTLLQTPEMQERIAAAGREVDARIARMTPRDGAVTGDTPLPIGATASAPQRATASAPQRATPSAPGRASNPRDPETADPEISPPSGERDRGESFAQRRRAARAAIAAIRLEGDEED